MTESKYPFYFAIADGTPTRQRGLVPESIAVRFGVAGPIDFVRAEPGFRLYRIRQAGSR